MSRDSCDLSRRRGSADDRVQPDVVVLEVLDVLHAVGRLDAERRIVVVFRLTGEEVSVLIHGVVPGVAELRPDTHGVVAQRIQRCKRNHVELRVVRAAHRLNAGNGDLA